ncbi:MAG: hypothetical protein HGA65_02015 [Oscillochloris sp.]|nr:hypothetical protein [Oscillochloris sp.]
MPDVLDLVDRRLLNHSPPRKLPFFFVPNLLGEYLLERPPSFYFDPVLIVGVLAEVVMLLLRMESVFWVTLGLLLLLRVMAAGWKIYRDVREDYLLLRFGVVTSAHVMSVRTCRDASGEASGAYVDCVIPISRRRTSVGSVWMPDAAEALRIGQTGRLNVICLTRSPGAWRLSEGDGPHLRYDPAGVAE